MSRCHPPNHKEQITKSCEFLGQVAWHLPTVAAKQRWRQKEQGFKVRLGYPVNCSLCYIKPLLI